MGMSFMRMLQKTDSDITTLHCTYPDQSDEVESKGKLIGINQHVNNEC